ncbi:MAG: alpha-amylase family glycosyl hydrolase, partial [Bacilli bacterium]
MRILELFSEIYGTENIERFKSFLNTYENQDIKYELNEEDSFLISYGDSLKSEKKGFDSLFTTLREEVGSSIKNVHILPMYPYTSDDGFSVVDYEQVRDDLGSWADLNKYSNEYGLMYDFVINHMSKSSEWFQEFLKGNNNYFVEYDESFNYNNVVRPRVSPLFHEIGGKNVWTTFSEDQVDLNFKEYEVFEEATRILIDYCKNGATFIRLDAIGFMWKESGT